MHWGLLRTCRGAGMSTAPRSSPLIGHFTSWLFGVGCGASMAQLKVSDPQVRVIAVTVPFALVVLACIPFFTRDRVARMTLYGTATAWILGVFIGHLAGQALFRAG